MIPSIDYVRAKNLNELLALLYKYKNNAKILAGGTDIIPGFHHGAARFKKIKILIDINNIPELKLINKENGTLTIGGAVTFSELDKSTILRENFPLLIKAISTIGSIQIRNRATMVGNFVNNAPCADSVPALLVYNAVIKIESLNQQKEIALKYFLQKPYQTQLNCEEVVTQIKLPLLSNNYIGDFYKLGRRRAVSISRITLALLMEIQNFIIKDIRIASGAITPIGMRFEELEEFARGKEISNDLYANLSALMGRQILAKIGLRWSSAYKLPVVQQMFYQVLCKVCNSI